jgi:hypothetical protein
MQKFVEKNRRLLSRYGLLAKIFGWPLVFVGCLALIGHSVALISRVGDSASFMDYFSNDVPWGVLTYLPTGCLVLGLAQFIRYLLDDEYQPGWILRNAVQFVYLYAIVFAIVSVSFCVVMFVKWDQWYEIVYRVSSIIFYGGAKVLFLVGLGQILRRIMPVIEESRTLV